MIWHSGIFINANQSVFQLAVSAGMYANNWIFTVSNPSGNVDPKKLLPCTMYFRFDNNKNFLSCTPSTAVSAPVREAIVTEIKKHEDDWVTAIKF